MQVNILEDCPSLFYSKLREQSIASSFTHCLLEPGQKFCLDHFSAAVWFGSKIEEKVPTCSTNPHDLLTKETTAPILNFYDVSEADLPGKPFFTFDEEMPSDKGAFDA